MRAGRWVLIVLVTMGAAAGAGAAAYAQAPAQSEARPMAATVGSKPFGENYLLAEMIAQVLEAEGGEVTRRFGLGGTEIIFPALQTGAIDLYPEYTGTGLRVILKEQPRADPAEVFRHVYEQFATRFDARWLPPLGFENTYAISVTTELASRLGLRTLTDLGRVSADLRAGFTADFIGLPDGLPGLRAAYGFSPRSVNALAPAVKYQALVSGAVDVIDAYSTDGLLSRYPLTTLTDDKRVFPPYDAAVLVRGAFARAHPEAIAALTRLSGRLDVDLMRRLNARVEVNGEETQVVAGDALRALGLLGPRATEVAPGSAAVRESWLAYLWSRRAERAGQTGRHLLLSGVSLLLAVLVAIPLALVLGRTRRAEAVVRGVGVLQTVPGLALLAFLLPLLGIGFAPAVTALFLYSLYPIVRNTTTGLQQADRGAVGAAEALGMTPRQVMWFVRMPLATPLILAGVRTAAVVNVGTATLAALVGAGGLGDPIVAGLALSDTRMILSGAVPAALLALIVDAALAGVQHLLTPLPLRRRS